MERESGFAVSRLKTEAEWKADMGRRERVDPAMSYWKERRSQTATDIFRWNRINLKLSHSFTWFAMGTGSFETTPSLNQTKIIFPLTLPLKKKKSDLEKKKSSSEPFLHI